jgi:hypothetical protein
MVNCLSKAGLMAKEKSRSGVSPAISTVIVTAATVVLVLVASQYAYRIIEQNRGAAEFASAKKAMLKLNDSVWYVSDKPQTSRATQFVAKYGKIMLVSNALNATVIVNVAGNSKSYSITSGLVKYRISTDYVTFGEGYKEYVLGNDMLIVTRGTENLGRIVVEQQSGGVDIILSYRVYVAKTFETTGSGGYYTYVSIRIIKIQISNNSTHHGEREFDVITKCLDLTTVSYVFNVPSDGVTAVMNVNIDGSSDSWVSQPLRKGVVVFNFIVSAVEVNVYGG